MPKLKPFTQGPLTVHEGEDYIHVYGGKHDHSEKPLATFAKKADAHLYAAAPDYRRSADAFVAFLATLQKGWLGKLCGDIGLLNEAYLSHSAAKAKAEGGKT